MQRPVLPLDERELAVEPALPRPRLRTATLDARAPLTCRHLERPLAPTLVDLTCLGLTVAHSFSDAERSRDLDVTIDDGLLATADPGLARLLLEHLLHRAARHAAREAVVRIELRRARLEELSGPSRFAVFVVRDNGRDTAVDHGLALASSIVERHGGRFRAVYGPARGAELYFSLPRPRSCQG